MVVNSKGGRYLLGETPCHCHAADQPLRSFSCLLCSPPGKLNMQLIDRFGTESSIGDVPCTVTVLCPLSHILLMSLVRNILSGLLTWNLRHYELAIVPMSANSNGSAYSCIIYHSSPSFLVDQIGTVDSAMTRTMRYVGLLDAPYMRTEGDHH